MDSRSIRLSGGAKRRKSKTSVKRKSKITGGGKTKINKRLSKSKTSGRKVSKTSGRKISKKVRRTSRHNKTTRQKGGEPVQRTGAVIDKPCILSHNVVEACITEKKADKAFEKYSEIIGSSTCTPEQKKQAWEKLKQCENNLTAEQKKIYDYFGKGGAKRHRKSKHIRRQKGGYDPKSITDVQNGITGSKTPSDLNRILNHPKTIAIIKQQPGLATFDISPYVGLLNRIISNKTPPASADYSGVQNVLGLVNVMKKLGPDVPGSHPSLHGLM